MTHQTLVDRAVASAIDKFSYHSHAQWDNSVEPLIDGAIEDAVDNLDVGATVHGIVYSLLDPKVMSCVNNWLTSAAVRGGPISKALDTRIKPRINKMKVNEASNRAASIITSSITKVFKDFKASERTKYESIVAPEQTKQIEKQQSTVHKNRNVSIMNAKYDIATGVMSNVNSTGVPYSNVFGSMVKISSPGRPTTDSCVLDIDTDLNMGILINVCPPTEAGHMQTKTLYLGSNESRTINFPLKTGTTSGICEISIIALMEMK